MICEVVMLWNCHALRCCPFCQCAPAKKYCFNHDTLTQRNRIVQTHVIVNQWEPMDVVELVGGAFAHGSVVSAWLQLCAWTEWMLAEKTMGRVVKFRDLSKPSMFMLCYVFWNMQRATCNSMVHVVPRIRPAQNGEALWVQRVLAVHRALSTWNQLPGKDSRVLDVFWTFGDVFGSNFGSLAWLAVNGIRGSTVDVPKTFWSPVRNPPNVLRRFWFWTQTVGVWPWNTTH